MCVKKKKKYNNIENNKKSWHNIWHKGLKTKKWPCLWIMQACKGGGGGLYPMFTSLKRPNRYTKCTKKTRNKQTLCVDCAAWAPTSKPADFWTSSFWLDIESTVVSSRVSVRNNKKKKKNQKKKILPYEILLRKKKKKFTIFRLRATNVLKVHCLWERFFIKRWSVSLFLPSHGNLLPETEHGKPKKSS